MLRVLDMFSGLGGWSKPFVERGHEVVTTDIDERFGCTVTGDILDDDVVAELLRFGPYDLVLASPPCEAFSVMRISTNWTPPPENAPKTDAARHAVRLVLRTLEVIGAVQPRAFIIENPRAKLRSLPYLAHLERRTVTYCQYGLRWMKPTDLWGGFPPTLMLRPPCSPRASCHEPAPRGSRAGVQGETDPAVRAMVPYQLALDVCLAMEELASSSWNVMSTAGKLY